MEIKCQASTGGGAYTGSFTAVAGDAILTSVLHPEAFPFSSEPFFGSVVLSFPADGLYLGVGHLMDADLLGMEVPEDYEIDPLLAMAALHVKVVEGNAIEITEHQYRHELEKHERDAFEQRARGRVRNEIVYALATIPDFTVEAGEIAESYSPVENDLGLPLVADHGDLHQRLLAEQITPICRHCPILPFCQSYTLVPSLNTPITIQGTVLYENQGATPFCRIGQPCTYPAVPVAGQEFTVAVRSYVTLQCRRPVPYPPLVYTTIKTILYSFTTNANGLFTGTIYAAPPFDGGLPYVEYVHGRTEEMYEVRVQNGNVNNFRYTVAPTDETISPHRYANSLIHYPACMTTETGVQCEGQTYNPISRTFTMTATFKEAREDRTFFWGWRDRLRKVGQKWNQWGINDTCQPLRAAWVADWESKCGPDTDCNNNFKVSSCMFMCNEMAWPCTYVPIIADNPFPNPAIYLLPRENGSDYSIRWRVEFPYHESGHWLWFLMQGEDYWADPINELDDGHVCSHSMAFPATMAITSDHDKCKCGSSTMECPGGSWTFDSNSTTTLTEAFAEAHMLTLAFVSSTGYGLYERASSGEIDSRCEEPYSSGTYPPACRTCGICTESPENIRLADGSWLFCDSSGDRLCTDSFHPACKKGPFSVQAAVLLDIFDNVNSPSHDSNGGTGSDTIYKPLGAVANAYINGLQSYPDIKIDSNKNLGHFLNYLKMLTSINLTGLQELFGFPLPPPILP